MTSAELMANVRAAAEHLHNGQPNPAKALMLELADRLEVELRGPTGAAVGPSQRPGLSLWGTTLATTTSAPLDVIVPEQPVAIQGGPVPGEDIVAPLVPNAAVQPGGAHTGTGDGVRPMPQVAGGLDHETAGADTSGPYVGTQPSSAGVPVVKPGVV